MSLRNIIVQYVGDTLYLPPLEREVKHIVVRGEDVNDWKRIEWTEFVPREDGEGVCFECNSLMYDGDQYCPNCGRKVDR